MIRQRYLDANGDPLAGGKLYSYIAGTSTPQATYTDQGGGTANANPVVLDANGEADVWLDPELSYKFVLKDSDDATQWTVDDVIGVLTPDAVNTAAIQDDAVTTAKLADDSVTADILADSTSVDGDRAVTTNHIRDAAITPRKLSILPLGGTINIGLAAATTTDSNDSIKITSADGTALSSTNPGYVMLPGSTGGQVVLKTITADVTLKLTGATLGMAADLADYPWHVYAINDAATLRWGCSAIQGLTRIDGSDDQASAGSITTVDGVLVNSALSGSSSCVEIGWFRANLDYTGGASEVLWAVQTGAQDIMIGKAPGLFKQVTITPSAGFGTTTLLECWMRKVDSTATFKGYFKLGTVAASSASIALPSGLVVASGQFTQASAVHVVGRYRRIQTATGPSASDDAGHDLVYDGSSGTSLFFVDRTGADVLTKENGNAILATNDGIYFEFSIPISGWDGNIA